jgi:hypothetical protein
MGRDMENFVSDNETAYEAAYEVMYPGAAKYYCWKEIEDETNRVRKLNRRKPYPEAKDIQTYGSRVGEAVLATVNKTARALPRGTTEGSDGD